MAEINVQASIFLNCIWLYMLYIISSSRKEGDPLNVNLTLKLYVEGTGRDNICKLYLSNKASFPTDHPDLRRRTSSYFWLTPKLQLTISIILSKRYFMSLQTISHLQLTISVILSKRYFMSLQTISHLQLTISEILS